MLGLAIGFRILPHPSASFRILPLFSLHVVSCAFDLEMLRVSGKNSDSGELGREKQLRISVLRKHTHKKHIFHTCVFPKHNGDESWKHNRVLLPFWCFNEDTHVRSRLFVETHPECRDC